MARALLNDVSAVSASQGGVSKYVSNCHDHEDGGGGYVSAGVEGAEGDFYCDGEVLNDALAAG